MTVQTKSWIEIFAEWAEAPQAGSLDFQGQEIPERLQMLLERGYFEKTLADYEQEVFEINDANGWFDSERSFGDDVALLHSEVSEMFEAYRDHGLDDVTGDQCATNPDGIHLHNDRPCKPEGVGSEAADIFIRLVDTCRRAKIDLANEVDRKNEFNRSRGYRHGGKRV